MNFKLLRFKETHRQEQLFVFTLNSREKNRNIFKRTIWDKWRKRFFRRFEGKGIGAMEVKGEGGWHIHLLVVFTKDYAESYVLKDIGDFARNVWMECNRKANGPNLKTKGACLVELPGDGSGYRAIRYISKLLDKRSFATKGFEHRGSFTVTHGLKGNAYWHKEELPKQFHSPAVLLRNLREYLRERRPLCFKKQKP